MSPPDPEDAPHSAGICPSCGKERVERFCGFCGEREVDPKEFRIRHFARQLFTELTNVDGRVIGSFGRLFLKPGLLTSQWVRGIRVRNL